MKLLLASLAASLVFAQAEADRTYPMSQINHPDDLQEVVVIVRSIAELDFLQGNPERFTMTFRGAADECALAEWLLKSLDRAPVNPPPPVEFAAPNGGLAKVYYLRHIQPGQDLMAAAALVRALTAMPAMMVHPSRSTYVVRGSPADVKLSSWLIAQLDQPEVKDGEFRLPGDGDETVKVLALPATLTPEQLQDVAIKVRGISGVPRIFMLPTPRAIVVRGSATQVATAGKMAAMLTGAR
ncbi:MAG: hypothetical protein K2X03_05320 [Bryobacteraceae bacterium]|nr:hypothetical protein [Bryobacteraceae bacterium]